MLKTFTKGGIHPPENKFYSQNYIVPPSLPEIIKIPLSQHIGMPAKAIVKRRDFVKTGQLIGKANGFISANIHSSVTGTIQNIESIIDVSGFRKDSISIKTEPDQWVEGIDLDTEIKEDINLTSTNILKKIQNAGIVGMGGATFPTHVKLLIPKGKIAKVLIINGVECEPYLTSDHQLMLEHGREIIIGAKLLMHALQVNRCVIGIENNKKDAIKYFKKLTKKDKEIEIVSLKVKYPQGGEKQLIKAVIRKEVPSGKLPVDVGAIVQNVGTVFAVYEAVQKNKPLIERMVTVTGENIVKPSNYFCRIGTSIQHLIKLTNCKTEEVGKIIHGGPMMGKAIPSFDIPITKGTSGILLFKKESVLRKEVFPCIRCANCTEVCPMGLEPFLLMTLAERKLFKRVKKELILNCIECGSCNYICPSNRPLLDYIRLGKSQTNKIVKQP